MNLLATFVDSLSREGAVHHIFGEQSYRVEGSFSGSVSHDILSLSEEPLYQVLVLVCMVFYFVWLYRYINKQGFASFVGAASAITNSRKVGVHAGSSSRRLGDTVLLWGLIVGIYVLFITKILEVSDGVTYVGSSGLANGRMITQHISQMGMSVWMGGIVVSFVWAMGWSIVVLYLADILSRSGTIFRSIFALRSQMLLYSVIYLMPIILLCAFGAYDSLRFYFALLMVTIFTLVYIIRTFLLFRTKKISILLWILYLCAVEIFPITLAWAFFTRS